MFKNQAAAMTVTSAMIRDLPALFEGGKQRGDHEWMVRCPAHDDHTPSLSLKRLDDRWLLKCLAGCDTADVLRAVNLGWGDVMESDPTPRRARTARSQRRRMAKFDRPATKPYPDAGEVCALWAGCEPVDMPRDEAMYAAEWLCVERGIHPAAVAARDLARVLTRRAHPPSWACYGRRSWYETGHRLVIPMFDCAGEMRGVRARGVLGHERKELAPQGVRSSGLVFADLSGRYLLEHGQARGINLTADGRAHVVICEGATDFLTWASTRNASDRVYPAVLGIASGAWTPEIAARVPDSACVLIDTDNDEAGTRYAQEIERTLAGRVELRRRPGEGPPA